MRPTIEVRHPDGRVETVELTRERTSIGRSSKADITVKDNRISRVHAAIELRGEKVYVVDLGGSNGTWIGSTKILANVLEPFPEEAVVYVGPAELRRVSTTPGDDPKHDLESQAFMPIVPQREASPGAPQAPAQVGYPAGSPPGQSSGTLEPSEKRLEVNPGERASLVLNVTNQSKIVDHYTLSVVGVPSAWVTVPRSGMELLPRQNGTLNVDLHPPRHPRTSAGTHPLSIALLNRQGQVVTQVNVDLEIGAYDDLKLDVRPNPYQSRGGGTLVLTVENHGNAETEYHVDVIEPTDTLDILVDPTDASVAPQQSRHSNIIIRPRKRNWIGDAKRSNLTVNVASSRQSASVNPAYTQLATIPRWLPIVAIMACCVIIPLFAFLAWPEIEPVLFPTDTPVPTFTPEHTPTPTPNFPETQTATRIIWEGLDDDGDFLTNGEEIELGTNPNQKDTDGDGLGDFDEVKRYDTDPLNVDSDGDTLLDGAEVNDPCTSPNDDDTDGDGVSDNADPNSCVGITPTPTFIPGFALGGQVHSSDNLEVMDDARMTWVKIQLRFGLGADSTTTVQDAAEYGNTGKSVLLSVVGNKEELERGGGYIQAFADFLGDISAVADAIEVWNEPNIQNEWPVGKISPADYTELLRAAYNAIKSTDPSTIVISAAPAPTGANDATVMSDDQFIKGMFEAGARQYMDCIGIHYNTGTTPPDKLTGHPHDSGSGHYSYYFLPMIDLYYDTFNPTDTSPKIPLCFTEIGFLTDDGFDKSLAQVGANGFLWAEGNSEFDQAVWLADSLDRSCRSGKVLLFIIWNVNFESYGQDPQAGYAILRPDGDCPACERLSDTVGLLRNIGCMN
jgi:hypothetical protein